MSAVAELEEVIVRSRESARLLVTSLPEAHSVQGAQPPATLEAAIAKYDGASETARSHAASMAAYAEGLRGKSSGQLDPNDEGYTQLSELEASFAENACFHWKASERSDIARRIPLRRAVERFALACDAMAAAARKLKGAIQAHDANDAYVHGRVPVHSPQELADALRKLIGP